MHLPANASRRDLSRCENLVKYVHWRYGYPQDEAIQCMLFVPQKRLVFQRAVIAVLVLKPVDQSLALLKETDLALLEMGLSMGLRLLCKRGSLEESATLAEGSSLAPSAAVLLVATYEGLLLRLYFNSMTRPWKRPLSILLETKS